MHTDQIKDAHALDLKSEWILASVMVLLPTLKKETSWKNPTTV